MWLFTTIGFFSIVQKKKQPFLTVRARVAGDLDRLRELYMPELSDMVSGAGTDYPYRATISHTDFARGLEQLAGEIHYSNFKSTVATEMGLERAHIYSNVWLNLHELEKLGPEPKLSQKLVAYGGVIIDGEKVLLRKPAHQHGGYAWTFPKAQPETDEAPEETALRATMEKGGVEARIEGKISGIYKGDTTHSRYFLMSLVKMVGRPRPRTAETAWVNRQEAKKLISQTITPAGRRRDLQVLELGFDLYHQLEHFEPIYLDEPRSIESEILTAGALRFDGYKYAEQSGFDLDQASEEYFRSGKLPESELEQMTMCFLLQRFLMKWGGEYLSERSRTWKLFRYCFLNTCNLNVPLKYRSWSHSWYRRWEREYLPKWQECITIVQLIHESTGYLEVDEIHPNAVYHTKEP